MKWSPSITRAELGPHPGSAGPQVSLLRPGALAVPVPSQCPLASSLGTRQGSLPEALWCPRADGPCSRVDMGSRAGNARAHGPEPAPLVHLLGGLPCPLPAGASWTGQERAASVKSPPVGPSPCGGGVGSESSGSSQLVIARLLGQTAKVTQRRVLAGLARTSEAPFPGFKTILWGQS